MPNAKRTYDVLISHAPADAPVAHEIGAACRQQGLDAVTASDLPAGRAASDALWDALAESRALLLILSAGTPTLAMAIELGAARAWNKPIFGVLTDPTYNRSLPGLSDVPLFTTGRIQDVIQTIRIASQDLSENDRTLLAIAYSHVGASVDQLALDPRQLEDLVRRFASDSGKSVPGERLLSELLRMRKQGRLLRSRSGERSGHQKGTA